MRTLLAIAFVALLAVFADPAPGIAQGNNPPQYYVSLGTSLAAGIQFDQKTGTPVVTEDAYTDQIHQRINGQIQNLQHIKLGCPAETSGKMLNGGSFPPCQALYAQYGAASQLVAAEAVLAQYKGSIAFVTIDVGANDFLPCLVNPTNPGVPPSQAGINACLAVVGPQFAQNLAEIITRLKLALLNADGTQDAPIIAINYYNPYLSYWLNGADGMAFAGLTNWYVQQINLGLGQAYGLAGIPVADVASAYHTYDETIEDGLPRNVKTICQLTKMCDYGDIHPNKNGYKVIAKTVEQLLKYLGII